MFLSWHLVGIPQRYYSSRALWQYWNTHCLGSCILFSCFHQLSCKLSSELLLCCAACVCASLCVHVTLCISTDVFNFPHGWMCAFRLVPPLHFVGCFFPAFFLITVNNPFKQFNTRPVRTYVGAHQSSTCFMCK